VKRAGALLALLALVFLAAACGEESTSGGGGTSVAVKLTEAGCDPVELDVAAGKTTFEVTNDGADAVTEFEVMDGEKVLGEAENVAPGLSGEFTIDLEPGDYTTYCPGGTTAERGKLTVTG
jgi:iron uptake system component EfeO